MQNIQIIATFHQDHGAGLLAVAPVTAYIGVRHMPEGHILAVVDIHNLPQHPGLHLLAHFLEMRCIAQHMAEVQLTLSLLADLQQQSALLQFVHHRFFQQDVITGTHGCYSRFGVLPILRADQRHLTQGWFFQQRLPGLELHLLGYLGC